MHDSNPQVDFQIPDLPVPPDECPISELLDKRVVHMTDDELAKYVRDMRQASESPQSLRRLLTRKGAKPKKSGPKVDMSLLGDL